MIFKIHLVTESTPQFIKFLLNFELKTRHTRITQRISHFSTYRCVCIRYGLLYFRADPGNYARLAGKNPFATFAVDTQFKEVDHALAQRDPNWPSRRRWRVVSRVVPLSLVRIDLSSCLLKFRADEGYSDMWHTDSSQKACANTKKRSIMGSIVASISNPHPLDLKSHPLGGVGVVCR